MGCLRSPSTFQASSPIHENVGFMAYNALCGGILTGKYMEPRTDKKTKRGRFDEPGWGRTLYRYYSGPALVCSHWVQSRRYDRALNQFLEGMRIEKVCNSGCRGGYWWLARQLGGKTRHLQNDLGGTDCRSGDWGGVPLSRACLSC